MADDLRQRLIAAVLPHLPQDWSREQAAIYAARLADVAVTIRDSSVDYWRERAEKAEREAAENQAAIARVRRLCDLTIAASCRVQAVEQARDTLAALDDTPETGRG